MEFGKHGRIIQRDIGQEMSTSYINYAMSVIISRALPDVRDGLKPVHRRCLYGMQGLNLDPDKPYKKSARVVGEVMGKYHPHGDSSIYDTIVRMAQDFSMRGILVDGQGNFGSVDGDSAAAMRYTEVRMSKLAMLMVKDLEKETVDWGPNFDESMEEPLVLPARFPNLLVNGSSGIAVGMATNMPPHNLGEVIDALELMMRDPDASAEEYMQYVKGPDFPTSAIIMGKEGIRKAFRTGKGSVIIRARALIETLANGRSRILVTELPYQVNKAKLIENIADLVRDKRLEGISDLRDESDRSGMRMVIELKRDANPTVVLNQLYKHTQMQTSFGINNMAIVDGQPRLLNLKEMLFYYLEHQKDVITRRTKYELRKAEEREHILAGYMIALDNLDEVIKLIRSSKDTAEARVGLMTRFGLSEIQSNAILEMRLSRLTGLEREKIEKEYDEVTKLIAHLKAILADEKLILDIIRTELREVREKFGDARRTQIVDDVDDLEAEDLIAEEDVIITLTHQGYIKRLSIDTYRSQRRGGRGVKGMSTKKEDFVEQLFITTTHHFVMFFTNRGRVYRLKAHEIPELGRTARGLAIINLLQLDPGEKVNAVIPVRIFSDDQYLALATRNGVMKKMRLSEFGNVRKNGLYAINLDAGDELIAVRMTDGKQKIFIGTRLGQAVCFPEDELRVIGRTARGVRGIRLAEGDTVVGMDVVIDNNEVLTVTNKGLGKRTNISHYRVTARGGKGVTNIKLTERNGEVIAVCLVKPDSDVIFSSKEGVVICMHTEAIPLTSGRATQGSRLMRLSDSDEVVDIAQSLNRSEDDEVVEVGDFDEE